MYSYALIKIHIKKKIHYLFIKLTVLLFKEMGEDFFVVADFMDFSGSALRILFFSEIGRYYQPMRILLDGRVIYVLRPRVYSDIHPGMLYIFRLKGSSHQSVRRLRCRKPSLVIWAALENKGFLVQTGFGPNERNLWCGIHTRAGTPFVIHAKGGTHSN